MDECEDLITYVEKIGTVYINVALCTYCLSYHVYALNVVNLVKFSITIFLSSSLCLSLLVSVSRNMPVQFDISDT